MTDTSKPNTLTEPLVTLIIPALILLQLSSTEHLGVVPGLLLALAFPLAWCLRDVIRRRKTEQFATHACPAFCSPRRLAAAHTSQQAD